MTFNPTGIMEASMKHPLIGRVPSSHARFPGRQFPHVGFGADLPNALHIPLLRALGEPAKQHQGFVFNGDLNRRARRLYRDTIRQHAAIAGLPLDQADIVGVLDRLDVLRGRYVHDDLTAADIGVSTENSADVMFGPKTVSLAWRHYPFAYGIWWAMAPHLRTSEMLRVDAVHQRLIKLFTDYYALINRRTFAKVSKGVQRSEMADFWLALFERTLVLHWESVLAEPRYVKFIAERMPAKDGDPILEIKNAKGHPLPLDKALIVRQAAYQGLLVQTMHRCAIELIRP